LLDAVEALTESIITTLERFANASDLVEQLSVFQAHNVFRS
jgi:hypothetical protein